MGYFLHQLKGEHSLYRGQIRGGTHGLLRHKTFPDVSVDLDGLDKASLTYRIAPNAIACEEYPLKVSLALTYAPRGEELEVCFRFRNHEPERTAHVGLPPAPLRSPSGSGSPNRVRGSACAARAVKGYRTPALFRRSEIKVPDQ